MKIVFLCGSLELGRDGVGDYTRLLAAELIKQGYQVGAIAINDQFVAQEFSGLYQFGDINLPIFRLPSIWPVTQRFDSARKWCLNFDPDWISLQFVPYSFHKKGIPFNLERYLLSFEKKYRWHIMFHELWLDKPNGIRQYIVAWAQRFIIQKCINKLKPEIVNVSVPFNKKRLEKLGIKSEILELFGNILQHPLSQLPTAFKEKSSSPLRILYFGGAPRGNYLKQVIEGLTNTCKKLDKEISIVIVSNNSINKTIFIELLHKSISRYGAKVIDCGFVKSEELSSLINVCTVGIVRSEPYLLGKSGSALAMLEHGMPIWMPKWNNKEPIDLNFRNNLIFSKLDDAINYTDRLPYQSRLPVIAKKIIAQFNSI